MVQSSMKIEEPFDLVQIDHKPADVIIVDDVNWRPICRPEVIADMGVYHDVIVRSRIVRRQGQYHLGEATGIAVVVDSSFRTGVR